MKEFENNIEKAMHSLDGMKRAQAPSHLTTGIFARIGEVNSVWTKIAYMLTQPFVAAACIAFIIALNLVIIFSAQKDEVKSYYATEEVKQVYEFYEIETLEP